MFTGAFLHPYGNGIVSGNVFGNVSDLLSLSYHQSYVLATYIFDIVASLVVIVEFHSSNLAIMHKKASVKPF